MTKNKHKVEIRTGSDSDIAKIEELYRTLDSLSVPYSARVLSAHRNPEEMASEARTLSKKGFFVCIAAAGGSAHLPGMSASETVLAVIGVPVSTPLYDGKDALFSIVQMPEGIPVGAVGPGQSKNAGLAAAQISSLFDENERKKIREHRNLSDECSIPEGNTLKVAIVHNKGDAPDEDTYQNMIALFDQFGISYQEFAYDATTVREIEEQGFFSIIALHDLSGEHAELLTIAEQTDIPVVLLPFSNNSRSKTLPGEVLFDLMSVDRGPLMAMGINRYQNAALFAAQIAGAHVASLQKKLLDHRKKLKDFSREQDHKLTKRGLKAYF